MKKPVTLILSLVMVLAITGSGKAEAEIYHRLTETGKKQTELVIPDNAKSIGMQAFLADTALKVLQKQEFGPTRQVDCG